MAYKCTLAVYKNERDWDRGFLYWSETYETEEEALEASDLVQRQLPGCITELYEEDDE